MSELSSLPETCKAVVLSTAGHRFALPLNAIARIVHRAMLQCDRNIDGIFYLDQQPLNTVNLRELLPQLSPNQSQTRTEAPFFVIVQLGDKQAGIAADQPPVLMDLPLQTIHSIPNAYQQRLQGLASHMISLEQGERMDSTFLLDLQRVATLMEANARMAEEKNMVVL